MHADIGMAAGLGRESEKAESPDIRFDVSFDPHYCRALIAKGSSWQLHLADWLRERLRPGRLRVNGVETRSEVGEWTSVSFAPGRSRNSVELQ
jgi:hypothetical protein